MNPIRPTREEVEELHGRVSRDGLDALSSHEVDELCGAYFELEEQNAALREQVEAKQRTIDTIIESNRIQYGSRPW